MKRFIAAMVIGAVLALGGREWFAVAGEMIAQAQGETVKQEKFGKDTSSLRWRP